MITLKVNVDIPQTVREIAGGAGQFVRQVAFEIEGKIKLLMALPKHGRAYQRRSGAHVASAPGEAPAVDTGFLINSIQTEFPAETEAIISVGAEYGAYLEFGSNRMAARPFAQPAIEGVIERVSKGGIIGGRR